MMNQYLTNGKQLSFEKAQVMAIINVTPDSFYDGGKYSTVTDIIKDAQMKISEGASIIDIGAASSRPNSEVISVEDEIKRLKEPLIALRREFPNTFISVDTYSSKVAEFAIDFGADIINDISGGDMDEKMIEVVAKHQIAYVLMHMKGTPQNMQLNPVYQNIEQELLNFFKDKIDSCLSKKFNKIIIDLGFGFGKTVSHNFQLLKNMNQFTSLGFPILVGLSRKSMINSIINTSPVTALNGTTVVNTIALQNGAKILRVHDVKEAKQAIDLFEYYKSV